MVTLKWRVERSHGVDGFLVVGTDDDAVRAHEVFNSRAFLEKFRIGHH